MKAAADCANRGGPSAMRRIQSHWFAVDTAGTYIQKKD